MKVINATQFKNDVARICVQGTAEHFGRVQRAVALTALKHIVINTPVDTGRARGGWQVDIDAVPTGSGRIDKTGHETYSKPIPKVDGPGHCINIANNVEYIGYLENGTPPHGNHPGTAPHAMVDRAIIQTLQTYARKV